MAKQETKKKKIKLPIGLIIIVLIVLIVVEIIQMNKKEDKNEEKVQNTTVQTQEDEVKEEKEEYVQVLQDGSKLNISEKLKENKKIGSLVLKDIQLTYKDGVTTLLANVENTSKETSKQKEVEITLVNEKEEKLYTLKGVIEEIEPGASKQLNSSITADFANAYNFTVKEK